MRVGRVEHAMEATVQAIAAVCQGAGADTPRTGLETRCSAIVNAFACSQMPRHAIAYVEGYCRARLETVNGNAP